MNDLKKFAHYMKDYKKEYILGVIALITVDTVQLIPPKIIGQLTDMVTNGRATNETILKYVLFIIISYAVISIGRYFWRTFIFGTSRLLEYDIRKQMFQHLQKMSVNFYNKNKTGDLMALSTNDLNAVRTALGPGIVTISDSIFLSISTIIIMLSINYKLTLLILIPLPFLIITVTKFGKLIHSRFLKVQEQFSKMTDVVEENFSGIRIIKSFVQENKECQKFNVQNEINFEKNMSLVKISGLFSPLVEFIVSLSYVTLIGIGGTFVINGSISLGDFISINLYLGGLIWPMMAIGWVINMMQRGTASLERIENILKQKPDVFDRNTQNINSIDGNIVIKDLSFKYPSSSQYALQNVNISIKKGQTLGIIGRTGSGKSTFVNLLLHLYNVKDGTIFINDTDINKIPLSTLRENIGFVPQDAFLFSTSIAENINLPLDNLNMELIEDASKKADLYDNIIDFKDKFETIVGERGATLSGGQKQRVSIARALVKNPEILIFDDCLSAVDAKTEVDILSNLKSAMENRTSIIISHRISAVKDSDIIIVFDEGKIKERGTHEELIALHGIYYDIFDKQQIEKKIQEEEV